MKSEPPGSDPEKRDAAVRNVTWTGLAINVGLSGFKFAAGILGNSQAMVADAVHSITDTVTDVAVIAGSHYWSQPPDDQHPYGHRRLETLVTVFIGAMLAAVGIGVGWNAVSSLHDNEARFPRPLAAAAALVSIIVKEALYRWTAHRSRQHKSPALAANAWHHRADAISSLPVMVFIGGAMLFPSWFFLDQVGAVLVSIFILHASFRVIYPGLSELIDTGAPIDVQKKIRALALENQRVFQVHGIRTRYTSSTIQADLHIVVDGSLTVREGHAIAEDVRDRICSVIEEVIDVVVHVDPPENAVTECDPDG
jgi:cation diffusion facilitator family transporter